jgi:hypothetical protein
MACLCDKKGFRQPWFHPSAQLRSVKYSPKWGLRLSGNGMSFTVDFELPLDQRSRRLFSKRVVINDDGTYSLHGERTPFYTLLDLLNSRLFLIMQNAVIENGIEVPFDHPIILEAKSHWESTELASQGKVVEEPISTAQPGKMYRYYAPKDYQDRDDEISVPELLDRLDELEQSLELLVKKLRAKNIL